MYVQVTPKVSFVQNDVDVHVTPEVGLVQNEVAFVAASSTKASAPCSWCTATVQVELTG